MKRVLYIPQAIAERHASAGDGGNSIAGHNDSYQIQRIGGGDDYPLGVCIRRQFAVSAQAFDRYGERELLADKPVDEPAAPNFTAIFETAVADL